MILYQGPNPLPLETVMALASQASSAMVCEVWKGSGKEGRGGKETGEQEERSDLWSGRTFEHEASLLPPPRENLNFDFFPFVRHLLIETR